MFQIVKNMDSTPNCTPRIIQECVKVDTETENLFNCDFSLQSYVKLFTQEKNKIQTELHKIIGCKSILCICHQTHMSRI